MKPEEDHQYVTDTSSMYDRYQASETWKKYNGGIQTSLSGGYQLVRRRLKSIPSS